MKFVNEAVNAPELPRHEFPRPDFVRDNWLSLNGIWGFEFDDADVMETTPDLFEVDFYDKILVPFCYQSELSGIGGKGYHPVVWYKKEFTCKTSQGRVLLKFGAVDYQAKVWVNGTYIGEHKGGNTGFEFDITSVVNEDNNVLIVKAVDYNDADKPRGKQSWIGSEFGCWYTPTTGIWQSVWIEYAGDVFITKIKMTPDIDNLNTLCEVFLSSHEKTRVRAVLSFSIDGEEREEMISEITVNGGYGKIMFSFRDYDIRSDMLFWSPQAPNLIDVSVFTIGLQTDDKVTTYFGMRKIGVVNGRILLNNHNLFQRLILDQGYWKESLLTPPSDQAIIDDIKLTKAMGFNGARKHQKIEDPRYYYWADKLGLLVWGEMPSAYEYNDIAIKSTTNELISFIERDYNHPCIINWVTINESWGVREILSNKQQQDYARMLYYLVKSLDKTRLVSSNDGWEQVDASDICTIHDYGLLADNLDKYDDMSKIMADSNLSRLIYAEDNQYNGEPVLMSEYGGIAFADGNNEGWGYSGKVKDEGEFLARLEPITRMLIDSGKFCGFCYTQLTDVMQEVNGLLTEDRKPKIDIVKLYDVFSKISRV